MIWVWTDKLRSANLSCPASIPMQVHPEVTDSKSVELSEPKGMLLHRISMISAH